MTQPAKKMPNPIVILNETSFRPRLLPPEICTKTRRGCPNPHEQFICPTSQTTIDEDYQGEDKKEKNSGGDTKKEEDRKEDKMQDSRQEVDDDDYLDYSDSDFIY